MNDDRQQREEDVPRAIALKTRVAEMLTTGVVVSLLLTTEALAGRVVNHNETVLALD